MRSGIATVICLLALPVGGVAEEPAPPADFVVSPSGNDADPGTLEKPFASLTRAQGAVRQRLAGGLQAPVTVLIRQGTYVLSEPLMFGPEDGGTPQHAVTYAAYPGEAVVLSGGREIRGWQRGPGDLWTTTVPGVREGTWLFRSLFVNGRRAVRACTPNPGAPPHHYWRLQGVDFQGDQGRYALSFEPGVVKDWQDPGEMEVMVAGIWEINRKRVQAVDPQSNTVLLAPPHYRGPGHAFPSAGRWGYFENAREFLDQPGEWYLHRATGVLSYWPLPGQEMSAAGPAGTGSAPVVVAPVLECLIRVTGTPQQPVRNLHLRGLQLAYAQWPLPPAGFMGTQACHYSRQGDPEWRWNYVPAAVQLTAAEGCSLVGCTLTHLGGCGVDLADGCRDNLIQGNHVVDVGGNGIMVGGPNTEAQIPQNNRVDNNYVHACGVEFFGGVGIWVGFAQGTTVSHNLVHDLPYTGISVGWEWGPSPTLCKANLIEDNHVYDVMNLLCDGAALYTLGLQPGTVIRGNHLHDVHRSPLAEGAPNNGIFADEGSTGFLFERNVIYATAGQPVRFNQCSRDGHTWKDNYVDLASAAEAPAAGQAIIAHAGLEAPWRDLSGAGGATAARRRRILYNLDGSGCLINKKGSMGPTEITAADLKAAVAELAYPGSQLDTLLVCINAQCTYYPSAVGTMCGALLSAERRQGEPFLRNLDTLFAQGVDPYALLLDEARRRGVEALLTYRMNDAHDGDYLRCQLWLDHPEYRLDKGLDFGHHEVREYTVRLIEEAVQRYDGDGIELDFNRFPRYFHDGAEAERIAQINELVRRVRKMLDAEGTKRRRPLVLAARVPTSYQQCRQIGLDPVRWAQEGWTDFLTVSEFLHTRYDLPVKPWKDLIHGTPIYASIECADGAGLVNFMNPAKYRRAARHLWNDGADGIYLFNFFCSREYGAQSFEPPFELLRELGDPKTLAAPPPPAP
jgi:hypothetical protein